MKTFVKKWVRRIALVFASLVIVLVIMLFSLVWYRTWTPFIDDGPFHGISREKYPTRKPDQEMDIMNNLTIKVYDRKDTEPAPTILLQNKDGDILWCIYAIGYEQTDVSKIRFTDYRTFPFSRPRVRGWVDWTYGYEGTWWFISKDGVLEEYWYSW